MEKILKQQWPRPGFRSPRDWAPLTKTLVFTKTAGRQPGWGHCYLRSSDDGRRKTETEKERLPPFPASSHRPSRIPSGNLAIQGREPRHRNPSSWILWLQYPWKGLSCTSFLSCGFPFSFQKYKTGIVLCYEQNHYISLIAERSGSPWIIKFGYLWIQEIFVVKKIFRPPSLHVSGCEMSHLLACSPRCINCGSILSLV